MNNKGQTLAIFVILIPVLLILFTITIDLGLLLNRTNRVKNSIVDAIDYGLTTDSQSKESEMYNLLKINIGKEDTIKIEMSNEIKITVKGEYKGLYKALLKNQFKYEYTYKGYIKNNEKIIIKEG